MPTRAYAAQSQTTPLAPFGIERRAVLPMDVAIDILYCGVCHSDLHQARNEWSGTIYPCVPGHEIVGRVARVGERAAGRRSGGTQSRSSSTPGLTPNDGPGDYTDRPHASSMAFENMRRPAAVGKNFIRAAIQRLTRSVPYPAMTDCAVKGPCCPQ